MLVQHIYQFKFGGAFNFMGILLKLTGLPLIYINTPVVLSDMCCLSVGLWSFEASWCVSAAETALNIKSVQLKIVYSLCSIQHIKDNFWQRDLITNSC